MIHIKKSTQPKKFQEFKQQNPQAHFDDMPPDIKAILRQSLLGHVYTKESIIMAKRINPAKTISSLS